MMLGEIVRTLRLANGWGTPELARRVCEAGGEASYQKIQQLESHPDRTPRYERHLAAAFGKTVEDLHAWKPGMPTLGPNNASANAQAEHMASGQPAPPGWVTRSDNHARLWRALDDAAGALSPAAAGALATLIGEAAGRRAAPEAQAHLAEAIRVVREGLAGQPPWAPERLLDVINGVAEALAEGGVARHRPVAELIEFAARRRA